MPRSRVIGSHSYTLEALNAKGRATISMRSKYTYVQVYCLLIDRNSEQH